MTVKSEPMSPEKMTVMSEPMSPDHKMTIKSESVSPTKLQIKALVDSDDDMPLSDRMGKVKPESEEDDYKPPERVDDYKPPERGAFQSDDDDDEPLAHRAEKAKKVKKEKSGKKRKNEEDDWASPKGSKKKKVKQEVKQEGKQEGKVKKEKKPKKEEPDTKWKWWEEEPADETLKWTFLQHRGPMLALPYEPLPKSVRFFNNGKQMKLSLPTEEVAGFYGKMLEHDYTTKEVFNRNFFKDWRKVMNAEEKATITDLSVCNFREMCEHYKKVSEERKAMPKDGKQKIKLQNEAIVEEYGYCVIDHHKQKIGNFRIEPPGLFRGRGDHPKQGMLKTRTMPEDVIINCSKDAEIPKAPEGRRWKEVRHDNTVTWLACWQENVQGSTKYVMLNAASKLKGQKDWKKYEVARDLHKHADKIRAQYREDWKSKEMRIRQRSVAMYFIDKLALRAGNEKDEDQADTVGCCSLRVEHITLSEEKDGLECVVEFDFLGKDSIRYYNKVPVEKRVFKNLQLFNENKNDGDDLFDRLNTSTLNKHLQGLMDGLTAKVFRTYNASKTLQEQLDLLTNADDPVPAKLLSYNRANRAVAVLCNHQRAVPKGFDKQMENLVIKIDQKKELIRAAKKEIKQAKSDYKALKTEKARKMVDAKKKSVERLEDQLTKLEVQATDKDENKEIALGTSKLNYLDPRISVAWCKKFEIPIEKIYNKTQREKFAWAIDMTEDDFRF